MVRTKFQKGILFFEDSVSSPEERQIEEVIDITVGLLVSLHRKGISPSSSSSVSGEIGIDKNEDDDDMTKHKNGNGMGILFIISCILFILYYTII